MEIKKINLEELQHIEGGSNIDEICRETFFAVLKLWWNGDKRAPIVQDYLLDLCWN